MVSRIAYIAPKQNILAHRLGQFLEKPLMTQSIYRLNGEYFGFIWQGRFFDKKSNYIGWVDGTQVWTTDNEYLGELVQGRYILRSLKPIPIPQRKGKCPVAAKPQQPKDCQNIAEADPKSLELNEYTDALNAY